MSEATTLIAAAKTAISKRPMGDNHRAQLLQHLRSFAASYGDSVDALTDENVNDWITTVLPNRGLGRKTQRAYRSSILNVWRRLHAAKIAPTNPGVVTQVCVPRIPPTAWRHDEVCKLLAACQRHRDGDWLAAYIQLTWSTGMRLCDCLHLDTDTIGDDGVYRLTQQKTGLPHSVHVNADAAYALSIIGGRLEYRSRRQMSDRFRWLVESAQVRSGTARWLRRSAASYVEAERPGFGKLFLGHASQDVADQHYFDPSITQRVVRGPSRRLSDDTSCTRRKPR